MHLTIRAGNVASPLERDLAGTRDDEGAFARQLQAMVLRVNEEVLLTMLYSPNAERDYL